MEFTAARRPGHSLSFAAMPSSVKAVNLQQTHVCDVEYMSDVGTQVSSHVPPSAGHGFVA